MITLSPLCLPKDNLSPLPGQPQSWIQTTAWWTRGRDTVAMRRTVLALLAAETLSKVCFCQRMTTMKSTVKLGSWAAFGLALSGESGFWRSPPGRYGQRLRRASQHWQGTGSEQRPWRAPSDRGGGSGGPPRGVQSRGRAGPSPSPGGRQPRQPGGGGAPTCAHPLPEARRPPARRHARPRCHGNRSASPRRGAGAAAFPFRVGGRCTWAAAGKRGRGQGRGRARAASGRGPPGRGAPGRGGAQPGGLRAGRWRGSAPRRPSPASPRRVGAPKSVSDGGGAGSYAGLGGPGPAGPRPRPAARAGGAGSGERAAARTRLLAVLEPATCQRVTDTRTEWHTRSFLKGFNGVPHEKHLRKSCGLVMD